MSWANPTGVLIVQHLPHEGPYAIGNALEAAGLTVRRLPDLGRGPGSRIAGTD